MKKWRLLCPQHIPDGQQYTEEMLRELNSELKKFVPKALAAMIGSFVGCIALGALFTWGIGGLIGGLLGILMMIFMPISMALFSKLAQKGYINAAQRIGLSPEQLKEAIQNRNKDTSPNSSEKIKVRKDKKKNVKRTLLIIGGVVLTGLVALFIYDRYLSWNSNRLIVELSAKNGTISRSDYEEIVAVLNRRAERMNARGDGIPIKLKCAFKDGVITSESNSNLLNPGNCMDFYMSGVVRIIDTNGTVIVDTEDILKTECIQADTIWNDELALTLSESAFDKLKTCDLSLFLETDYNEINENTKGLSNLEYNYTSSFLVNNADGTTVYFKGATRNMYDSIQDPLPMEMNIEITKMHE
ncbi:MAG: hypothetical protein IKS87_02690 [Lachnospiraceae bacterium]|nr:hypothetical protein [Lachnospiraceae bacterium]